MEKQTEKQVDDLKSLIFSKKTDELKQIEGIFSKNQCNDLIIDKLKKIVKFQDIVKLDELYYKSKHTKTYKRIYTYFSEYSLPIFLRDIHEKYLSLKDADDEQSKFANKLKNISIDINSVEKKFFLNNIGLFYSAK